MCNIAGYSGSRQAAPILLEMLRRQQYYDSEQSTGVATIHEGKLYYRKLVGDVDHLIREARERLGAAEFTQATGHAKYRRLSEVVCGYGYSMRFSEERFAKFYPGETRWLVAGFAEGYSTAFHSIATEAGLYTDQTLPVGQDIWKNWAYFLEPDCREYRLDGKYLFMYHGGINCSDTAAPYGDNQKNVNAGVYKALQARDLAGAGDRFGEIVFNF